MLAMTLTMFYFSITKHAWAPAWAKKPESSVTNKDDTTPSTGHVKKLKSTDLVDMLSLTMTLSSKRTARKAA
ncbi:hypothetical protein Tco_0910021 [Tanacetum coccineum]|uniref:Secreted protein n=1 Tax=Tanacetum coccineum TaxID=301880 RepID=A0ABQ5CV32_9ASTR